MITPGQRSPFAGPNGAFGIPAGNIGPNNLSFNNFNGATFGSPQQTTYQPDRHGPSPLPRRNPPDFHMPPSTSTPNVANLNVGEDFWQQMEKVRTGLTPGVNLDELFGSDGGWHPVYMDQGFGRTQ